VRSREHTNLTYVLTQLNRGHLAWFIAAVLDFFSPKVLGLRRRRDVAGLVTALQTGGPRTRRAAANALIALPDRRASEALVHALADDDAGVRMNAALALGEPAGGAGDVTDALCRALRDPEPRVRALAASSLGRLKAAASLDSLIDALGDDSPTVRRTAAIVLSGFDDPRAAEALAAAR
jgi:HEAT repeat protein